MRERPPVAVDGFSLRPGSGPRLSGTLRVRLSDAFDPAGIQVFDAAVDPGEAEMLLPPPVAELFGLPTAGWRSPLDGSRRRVERLWVAVDLPGVTPRESVAHALVDPAAERPTLGWLALAAMDLLVTPDGSRVIPRDPTTMLCEV